MAARERPGRPTRPAHLSRHHRPGDAAVLGFRAGHRAPTGQLADHFARHHHPDVSDCRHPGVRKSDGRPKHMKTSALTQAGLDRLHQAMAARVENRSLPGIVTLVAQGDDAYADVIGSMAFGGDRPMRRDTIFRITSMTKPILGAATMLLVDDGQLALDEPVTRLLPELAARRVLKRVDGPLDETVPADRPITVEDLLTFRPGYGFIIVEPTTFNPPYPIIQRAEELQLAMAQPDPRTPHDPDKWIARFATLPLMYQPGERWQYNVGSLVLGVLVARAADQPLGVFLQDRLFEPLGMRDTGFVMPADQVGRLPTEYATDFFTGKMGEVTITGPDVWTTPPPFPSGAGGLLSTVAASLASPRLLLGRGVHHGRRLLSEAS